VIAHPNSRARVLLDRIKAEPGISRSKLVDVSGQAREIVGATLRRFEASGHLSSDDVGKERHYWMEVPLASTLQDRILIALARGPKTWREIQDVVGVVGMVYALNALERAGKVLVIERTEAKPDGRTVRRPNAYRLA
jgi:hypothetical protein